MFQPAQLLQVRQSLAQQQSTVVAAQQAWIQKRIEAEAGELVKKEKEKQKQKSDQDANATKQTEDATTSR